VPSQICSTLRDTGGEQLAMEAAGERPSWIELRIHGVGGSPGDLALGPVVSPTMSRTQVGLGTQLLRRNDVSCVEAYDWGLLSSGSPRQALWLILLPFSLVNVAGHMAPHGADGMTGRRPRLHDAAVRLVGFVMTLTWASWLAVLLVDVLGLQWMRHIGSLPSVADLLDRDRAASALLVGRLGMGVGVVLLVGMFVALRWLSGRSLRLEDGWEQLHLTAVIGIVGATVLQALQASPNDLLLDKLDLGGVLLAAWWMQAATVLALFVMAGRWGDGPLWRRLAVSSASAAALACVMTNLFFASLSYYAADRAAGWPPVPDDAEDVVFGDVALHALPGIDELLDPVNRLYYLGNQEHSLTDVWLQAVLVATGAMAAVALVLYVRRRPEPRRLPNDAPLHVHGIDRRIRRSEGVAAVVPSLPSLLWFPGVASLAAGVVVAADRIVLFGPNLFLARLDFAQTEWHARAARFLPLVVAGTALLLWRAARDKRIRRTLGVVWDVLTFFPSTHHPLAVRSSGEQVSAELRALLAREEDRDRHFLVSAHSQGSVLAFKALSESPDDVVARCSLLTYGSPLATLYERLFPAEFSAARRRSLHERLLRSHPAYRWRSFHRRTDPIGGPVDPQPDGATSSIDEVLADPPTGPIEEVLVGHPSGTFPPIQSNWGPILGHSQYDASKDLQDWVDEVKALPLVR
jgi:hypothetical protein